MREYKYQKVCGIDMCRGCEYQEKATIKDIVLSVLCFVVGVALIWIACVITS